MMRHHHCGFDRVVSLAALVMVLASAGLLPESRAAQSSRTRCPRAQRVRAQRADLDLRRENGDLQFEERYRALELADDPASPPGLPGAPASLFSPFVFFSPVLVSDYLIPDLPHRCSAQGRAPPRA